MPIEIVSYRFKRQFHQHRCPICNQVRREPNDVCAKVTGDHVYPDMLCLQDQRRRFSDDILDAYIGERDIERLHHVVPDQLSDYLDLRDAERRREQARELARQAKENPEAFRPKSTQERKQEAHDTLERLREDATVITEEEAREELKKIAEKEKI
jgi:pyruvate-formate lyase